MRRIFRPASLTCLLACSCPSPRAQNPRWSNFCDVAAAPPHAASGIGPAHTERIVCGREVQHFVLRSRLSRRSRHHAAARAQTPAALAAPHRPRYPRAPRRSRRPPRRPTFQLPCAAACCDDPPAASAQPAPCDACRHAAAHLLPTAGAPPGRLPPPCRRFDLDAAPSVVVVRGSGQLGRRLQGDHDSPRPRCRCAWARAEGRRMADCRLADTDDNGFSCSRR